MSMSDYGEEKGDGWMDRSFSAARGMVHVCMYVWTCEQHGYVILNTGSRSGDNTRDYH
jgi:hypothetical protein